MANKTVHQHYIPQLLLRGFCTERDPENAKVWVFRRQSAPFLTSTRNIGGERYFYADPDDSSVEADLAEREGVIAKAVAKIRSDRKIPDGYGAILAELAGQMVARTKSVREGLATAGETTMRDALEVALRPEELQRRVKRTVEAKLATQGVHLPPDVLRRITRSAIPSFLAGIKEHGGIERLIEGVDIAATAKNAQVQALSKNLAAVGDRFEALRWRLMTSKDFSFILGDAVPIALKRRKRGAKPGIMFSADHDLLVLPVSDSLAIVGGKGDFSPEELNLDRLNTSTAKLSAEFFVSRTNQPRDRALQQVLGLDLDFWVKEPRRRYRKNLGKT
jgi:hypothetical protein